MEVKLICFIIVLLVLKLNDCYLQIGENAEYEKYGINSQYCGYRSKPVFLKINFPQNCFRNTFNPNIVFIETLFGTEKCGDNDTKPVSRVVGGVDAQYYESPWTVLIQFYYKTLLVEKQPNIRRKRGLKASKTIGQGGSKSDGKFILSSVGYCTGVLIAPQWVLTAEHCWIEARKDLEVYIHLGTSFGPFNKIKVYRSNWYPCRYTTEATETDVALIQVFGVNRHYDSINRFRVNTVCLPHSGQIQADFTGRAVFYGFGLMKEAPNPVFPRCLQKAVFHNVSYCPNEEVCVYLDTTATCTGDSGGGLVEYQNQKAVLMGILVETKQGVCLPNVSVLPKLAAMVDISRRIDWILRTIKKHHRKRQAKPFCHQGQCIDN